MKKSARISIRMAVLLLVAGAGVFAYVRFRQAHKIPDLPTAPAKKGEFAVVVTCRGNLTASRSVQLTAPVDVQDLQIVWLAPSGGTVHAGETVVRFDPSKLQQDIREKSAIDLRVAEEKVHVEEATVELHRKSDEAKIASQARLRDEARNELKRTKRRLEQMELKSPLEGVIEFLTNQTQGWLNSQPYKVGDHVSAGLAIAEIPDMRTLEMESKVDEVDRGRIATGDEVRIHVDAFPEKVFKGKLTAISLLTEQSFTEWPPSRTFRAFAQFDERDARLRSGMNAGTDIVQEHIPDAISVPARALFTLNGKPVVYVKTQEGFVPKQVRVRARNTDEVAVEGVAAGTVVALTDPEQKTT
jgi:RND family efflux transporter MFP subunit